MTQRTSFAKLQRDREKQAKAAAKRDRRKERQSEERTVEEPEILLDDTGREFTGAELLSVIETVHRQFEEGVIDFETFEEKKAALLARISVD